MSVRKLVGTPILLQDWGNEAEEGASKYWELFLDLLMVAAATAVADGLKENQTLEGIRDFLTLILLFLNGSTLYLHITTRFEDGTFAHIMILFILILGNATCIVNADMENSSAFASGTLIQRASIVIMLLVTYFSIPRARVFCTILGRIVFVEMVVLSLVLVFKTHAPLLLSISALMGLFLECILVSFIRREDAIPINIEHSKDRMGILLLIMLGETVVSVTIEHRHIVENVVSRAAYYWVLFWALVLVFFYTQFFFAISPPPAFHAFRRSQYRALPLIVVHKSLCASALAGGTCIKLTVDAIAKGEELTDFTVNLMSISVGCSFVLLVLVRMLHFLGVFPTGNEPPSAYRLMNIWWIVIAVASIAPFLGLVLRVKDPVISTAMYAGMLFVASLVETTFMHMLEPYVNLTKMAAEMEHLRGETDVVTYQST